MGVPDPIVVYEWVQNLDYEKETDIKRFNLRWYTREEPKCSPVNQSDGVYSGTQTPMKL